MFSRYSLFLVPATFAMALSSCQLSDNAQKSAENSRVAAENSSKMVDLSENAYGDGRQGAARDRREKAFENMISAKKLTSKMTAAAAFYNALEYQLYKTADGFREDNQAKLDRMITDGVIETLRDFHDFTPVDWSNADVTQSMTALIGKLTADSMADHANATNTLNAFAMAGSLHKISERQVEAARRYKFTARSMLDIFAEILLAKKNAETDPAKLSQLPPYVYEGLRLVDEKSHDLLITQMLELRLNLMMFSAAADLMDLAKTNAVMLQDSIDKLKAALQVKSFLFKANLTPHLFADVKGGLGKFVADTKDLAASADAPSNPLLPKILEAREIADLLVQ